MTKVWQELTSGLPAILDEFIDAIDDAGNEMMDIKKSSGEELDASHEEFAQMRAK